MAPLRHGHAVSGRETPTYRTWQDMKKRCTNPRHKDWASYGGRGITVCERWRVFAVFLEDMGERPDGMTLDRRDPDGHYEPGNCRWATARTQARNTRKRHLRSGEPELILRLSAGGVPQREIARRLGMSKGMVHNALTGRARVWALGRI